MRRLLPVILIAMLAASCFMQKSPETYIGEANALIEESRYREAGELMRQALYRYPDNYGVCMTMGRAAKGNAKKFIPGDRGLYVARHYFKKAASLAPDAARAAEAEREYDEAMALQGIQRP